MATIPEALLQAKAYHRSGQFQPAEQIYRKILQVDQTNAEAGYFLGAMLQTLGRLEESVAYLRQSVRLEPRRVEAHNHLGTALAQQGELDEAIACFRQTLRLRPDFAEAHNNLGNTLRVRGELGEAIACYRRALELRPDYAHAYNNLGVALKDRGQRDEAIVCYRRAIELKPDHAQAHCNLGVALRERGELGKAVACHRRAVELEPGFAVAHSNLGNALMAQGEADEAVACYRRAVELEPGFAVARSNLGHALTLQGEADEAVACYRRAIELEPDLADAHNGLGFALKDRGELGEAIACYRRAVELKPDFARAHSNLVFALIFSPDHDSRSIYEENRLWNRKHAEPLARFIRLHSNDRSPDRRLRVGYVSSDFRNHCQCFFTLPLLSAHDHQDFEIFCYADVENPDHITARLRLHADAWRDITGLGGERTAELIREDGIDVLVDLTMHMGGDHLEVFARKPAPVQVCWLAYPGTTGLSTMDYRLTDRYLDPPGLDDRYYSEESYRLPDAFWCYDPLTSEPAVNALPALANGHVTFGSLNNFCKVNDRVLELWARVLRAVDRSRLVLLAPEGGHRGRTLGVLEREGVAPDRVTFVATQSRLKYLGLYHGIDIGLDPFPANGHTTSLDASWMGVPVVTIVGETAVGRGGVCLLTHLGLPELIADTPERFVSIAVGLAADLPRLGALRETLRDRMQKSPLMDAPRFARNVEVAYRSMWQRWCATCEA